MIVAGGLATRMRPMCEKIPKCLIDIHGKPLIEHQLAIFKEQGFREFIFCVAHLGEKVEDYFGDGSRWGLSIRYSMDGEKLLGTAGAVKSAAKLLPEHFMVYYGDAISRQNFNNFVNFHFKKKAVVSISLRERPRGYKSSSLITLDQDKITHFIEKPSQMIVDQYEGQTTYINNGIFIVNKSALKEIPEDWKSDFSFDLFPRLIAEGKNVCGYVSNDFYVEIGRPEKYKNVLEKNMIQ